MSLGHLMVWENKEMLPPPPKNREVYERDPGTDGKSSQRPRPPAAKAPNGQDPQWPKQFKQHNQVVADHNPKYKMSVLEAILIQING